MNFKSKEAYRKWLAHGHIHGTFEKTPGHQKIKIRGKPHRVRHHLRRTKHGVTSVREHARCR